MNKGARGPVWLLVLKKIRRLCISNANLDVLKTSAEVRCCNVVPADFP